MLTWRLALTNGLVIDFGGPWLDPDGQPAKGPDGQELPLQVGGIFPQWEETETIVDDDGEGEGEEESETSATVETQPACYLVFAKPKDGSSLAGSKETRVRRVFLSGNVMYAEEAWPTKLAAEFIQEEMKAMLGVKDDSTPAAAAAAAPAAPQQQQQQHVSPSV